MRQIRYTPDLSLDEILIKNENIKTISYSDLVSVYSNLFSCGKKTEIVLERLGRYRNAITHFGIDQEDNLNGLFNTIFESFDIILNVLYPQLLQFDECFFYDDVIDFLDDWIECGYKFQLDLCIKNPAKKIGIFTQTFQGALSSSQFATFLSEKEIKMIPHILEYDNNNFWIEFEQSGNYIFGLYSHYSPFHNATIFTAESGTIYFIVEHDNDNIYLYEHDIKYEWEPEKYKRWKDDIDDNLCKVKKISDSNLLNIMKQLF